MRVLIIEDEEVAANRLESQLKEIDPDIEVMAKLGSISASTKWLLHHKPDLILLDIQLSDGLSFKIFEQVSTTSPIIFTTAYNQYAIKAFELNSVAYLLKPIRKSDLKQSLDKLDAMKSAFSIDFDNILAQYEGRKPSYKNRFLIRLGEKFTKVETSDIAYCYALEKDVYAKTSANRTFPMDYSLDQLEDLLDPKLFFRINRKFLVGMHSIQNMIILSRSRIKLELAPKPSNPLEAVVSINRSADFRRWMDG
jgi:DNA-binding LytR/AlgR family response regulator